MKILRPVWDRVWRDVITYRYFLAAFAAYDLAVMRFFRNFCPSVIICGMPCPGWGTTRAVFYFITGQFEKGWAMHPVGIGWLLLAAYFCLMRYILGKRPVGVLQMGALLAVCMEIVYVWRMFQEFPGEAPMAYVPGSLLEQVVPGYLKIIEKIPDLLNGFGR